MPCRGELSIRLLTTWQLAPSEVSGDHFCHMLLLIQGQPWCGVGGDYTRVGIPGGEGHWENQSILSPVENSIFENFPGRWCSVLMASCGFENYFLY